MLIEWDEAKHKNCMTTFKCESTPLRTMTIPEKVQESIPWMRSAEELDAVHIHIVLIAESRLARGKADLQRFLHGHDLAGAIPWKFLHRIQKWE